MTRESRERIGLTAGADRSRRLHCWPADPAGRKMVGRSNGRTATVQPTVTLNVEVRPMNAVPMWVLPLSVMVGR